MFYKLLVQVVLFVFPWSIRRPLLCFFLGYKIDETAKIGLSIILAKSVNLEKGSSIGHLNLLRSLDCLELSEFSVIGRTNSIVGYSGCGSFHLSSCRASELKLGRHAAITNSHHIDCTNVVRIGEFSTIAGYGSQILTHTVNLEKCRQTTQPVDIGPYSFIGTRVVVLPGVSLAKGSVIAAGAVVNRSFDEAFSLIGGVPAKFIKGVKGFEYFQRGKGEID